MDPQGRQQPERRRENARTNHVKVSGFNFYSIQAEETKAELCWDFLSCLVIPTTLP